MSSFVSSILQHSANRIDDMPFLGSRSKRQSLPTGSSSGMMANNYQQQQQQQQYHHHRSSAEYYHPHSHHPHANGMPMAVSTPPPSYEAMMMQSPSPTPSTSWTSDMNALADRIKDEDYMISSNSNNNNSNNANNKQLVVQQLDRRSISQGLKLVSIAADEYDGGNEAVALDIYLTGLDKILMALPNKTDPKTKLALREKLLSVEERVGILNLAKQKNNNNNDDEDVDDTIETIQTKGSLQSYIFSRITTTISTISNISSHAETRYEHVYQEEEDLSRRGSNRRGINGDPLNRFKRFGQFVVQMTVTMAILIKQSPLPDIFCFLFGYFIQFLIWFDSQYHVVERVQDFEVECLKMLLQADEEYRLHELVSEAVYMLIAAGLKAVVAFKEAPGYKEQHQRTSSPQRRHHYNNRSFSSSSSSPPPPPSPVVKNNSRITWSWTPW